MLFHECGVYFGRRTRHDDGISDERRLAAAPSSLATGFMLGDIGFRREMLLQVVPEEGQDVLPADIHYYDDPPFDDGNYLAHGVDLVISTKESADYTAIVSGEVAWEKEKTQLYVQPNPIIRHMNFTQTMETLDNVRRSTNMSCEFFVEAVAYQAAAIEEMERRAFSVQAMHPIKDKRAWRRGTSSLAL